MADEISRANEIVGRTGSGGDDTAAWEEALPLYLTGLHRARLAEALHPMVLDPKKLHAMTSPICFNVACYWAAIHRNAAEAAPWLEESVRLGLLDKKGLLSKKPKLSKFLEDKSFDGIRDAAEIRGLVAKYG